MSGNKCRSCGSTDIETDSARGNAVCVQCGVVFEDQLIVSETTFEETPSGNMMVLGQFVASDSTGGATGFGAAYHVNGKESREITIQNARKGITHLCMQLQLNQHCIDTAVNFYKMALSQQLTRGRKQAHNHAACVYITCRTEGTAHMLIDISDVLQICVYELGRTYLRFTQALCINIPSMDPCLYIIRFANRLEFGEKTHEVSMTALRVVQRMKRDSIHSGRRPSGLCGAALLMAARLHEFNRSPSDIIKIVKVHESTLRKRLIEFGDTPSSALTLEEFMTVDLEEEQDPPAFKVARRKDRERLQKLENMGMEFNELQKEIEKQLNEQKSAKGNRRKESSIVEELDADRFITESNLSVIQHCMIGDPDDPVEEAPSPTSLQSSNSLITGLGPDIASMGLASALSDRASLTKEKTDTSFQINTEEIDITDFDDDELDGYILTEKETQFKTSLWNKVNAQYLVEQKEKEEKRQKEKEEGKPEKKRRRTTTKKNKNQTPANSAGEAIEKMLQEKRISSKINYEVLKSLNVGSTAASGQQQKAQESILMSPRRPEVDNVLGVTKLNSMSHNQLGDSPVKQSRKLQTPKVNVKRRKKEEIGFPVGSIDESTLKVEDQSPAVPVADVNDVVDDTDDYVDEDVEPDPMEMTVGEMLGRHTGDDDYEYGYEDEDY
ncbi:transcription factor IIIB 90 kDa subunit isoform X2 [Cephus cinctus]|nr:transcription factor IIIB 90 kDa subunit isoform X2 [Cephus cinctus]XP_015593618.1 transcription factor IIIB 90 kDa subunit isoform X2 [Cephus cinctus]